MKGHKWAYFGSLIILMQVNNVRLLILLLKDAFIVDVLKVISLILSTSYIIFFMYKLQKRQSPTLGGFFAAQRYLS